MQNIDKYFMEHAKLVSTRSKCVSRHVGAILVKDTRIISLGYNGTPKGYKDCINGGCPRCQNSKTGIDLDKCYCVHSEINCILFAARNGINIRDSVLYTTSSPCLECAKAIVNGGIKRVIYHDLYNADALRFLIDCRVKIKKV